MIDYMILMNLKKNDFKFKLLYFVIINLNIKNGNF